MSRNTMFFRLSHNDPLYKIMTLLCYIDEILSLVSSSLDSRIKTVLRIAALSVIAPLKQRTPTNSRHFNKSAGDKILVGLANAAFIRGFNNPTVAYPAYFSLSFLAKFSWHQMVAVTGLASQQQE